MVLHLLIVFSIKHDILSEEFYFTTREICTLTLRQLQYIITVAARGSITEAAKELFIAQPSLTAAIREL